MPEQSTPGEAELVAKLARATAENERLGDAVIQTRTENKLLREKIDALLRRLFGAVDFGLTAQLDRPSDS